MKKINYIRQIDDLGRIIIPQEIINTLQIKESAEFEITLTEKGDIIFTPHLSKEEKLHEWMTSIFNKISKNSTRVYFHFYDRVIVCVYENNSSIFGYSVGVAICSPYDEYNEYIGQCIAYCRAVGTKIPDFVLQD